MPSPPTAWNGLLNERATRPPRLPTPARYRGTSTSGICGIVVPGAAWRVPHSLRPSSASSSAWAGSTTTSGSFGAAAGCGPARASPGRGRGRRARGLIAARPPAVGTAARRLRRPAPAPRRGRDGRRPSRRSCQVTSSVTHAASESHSTRRRGAAPASELPPQPVLDLRRRPGHLPVPQHLAQLVPLRPVSRIRLGVCLHRVLTRRPGPRSACAPRAPRAASCAPGGAAPSPRPPRRPRSGRSSARSRSSYSARIRTSRCSGASAASASRTIRARSSSSSTSSGLGPRAGRSSGEAASDRSRQARLAWRRLRLRAAAHR